MVRTVICAIALQIIVLAALSTRSEAQTCGDNVRDRGEQCDGSDDDRCRGLCDDITCTCPEPVCGNDVIENQEDCDGSDDSACPGFCDSRCECGEPGACCDWSTGVCVDVVTPESCQGLTWWLENRSCREFDCYAATAWFEVVPVEPQGLLAAPYPDSVSIDGNTITVWGGPQRVWVEVRVGGWAPEELRVIQGRFSGLSSGAGDPLEMPVVACGASGPPPYPTCEEAFGPRSLCKQGNCQPAWMDVWRPDFVFAGINGILYSSIHDDGSSGFGALVLYDQPPTVFGADNGVPYYLGTAAIDVPPGAAGTYTLEIDLDRTFLSASGGFQIPFGETTPAIIRVVDGCCAPDGACLAVSQDMCDSIGGVLAACGGDCDGNGIPDGCDTFADCNDSGLPDSCDIANGTSTDDDGNCIPDECDAEPAPLAESAGVPKGRFISFETVSAGCQTAIRVELVSLNHPDPPSAAGIPESDFSAFEGQYRWVGPPERMIESLNPTTYFTAAMLQCEPHFMDWGSVGLIHIYGTEIVPSSIYDVQFVDEACGSWSDPACGMKPLTVTTGRWGDVVAPYHTPGGVIQPDFSDIASVHDKFRQERTPLRASAELVPNLPEVRGAIDFNDVSAAVDAFTGATYPFAGPEECP